MSNDRYPMIIEHWTFFILHSISPVLPRRPDTGGQDRQQLLTLPHYRLQRLLGTKLHLAHELEPRASFTQLLEADPELVDEVASRFGSLYLAVVRKGRRPAAGDLRADVPGDRSRRKAVSQQADLHGNIDKPIFEVIAPPGHNRCCRTGRRRSNQTYADVVQAYATGGESTAAADHTLRMSNIQYPTLNVEIGYWILDILRFE